MKKARSECFGPKLVDRLRNPLKNLIFEIERLSRLSGRGRQESRRCGTSCLPHHETDPEVGATNGEGGMLSL